MQRSGRCTSLRSATPARRRRIDPDFAGEVTSFLRDHGMIWQAPRYSTDVDDLKPELELVARLGADDVQPNMRPQRIEACIPLLEGWRRLGKQAGRCRARGNPPRPHDHRCVFHAASQKMG